MLTHPTRFAPLRTINPYAQANAYALSNPTHTKILAAELVYAFSDHQSMHAETLRAYTHSELAHQAA